jgi:hypothetical protein
MYGQPKKITNRVEILEICRKYLQTPGKFLYALHDRNENVLYEGPAIMGIVTSDSDITITLTNSDSNFSAPSGIINFFDIEYIQEVEV